MNAEIREPDGFEPDGAPFWKAGGGTPLKNPRVVVRDGGIFFIESPLPVSDAETAKEVSGAVLSAAAFLQRDGEL